MSNVFGQVASNLTATQKTANRTNLDLDNVTEARVSEIESQLRKSTTINFASDANLTLTADQNKYGRIELTDLGVLLTAIRDVIVDTSERNIVIVNNTLQDLKIKTSGGTGFTVQSGLAANLRCDGTNVLTGVGCEETIVPFGAHITGETFSYPDSHTQSNYKRIDVITTSDTATTTGLSSGLAVATEAQIKLFPTTWKCRNQSATGNISGIDYLSTTSFVVFRSSDDGVAQVIGHLKEGVTS